MCERRRDAKEVGLLRRHSSSIRSRRLERAIEGHFDVFLWKFEPQNVVGHRVKLKRHILASYNACFVPVCVKIHGPLQSASLGKNKKEALYFTYFARRSLTANFGLRVRLVEVINRAKFYRSRLRDPGSVRGRIYFYLNC